MELITFISELVKDLGFPIACVIAMYVELGKQRDNHAVESSRMVEALNNNTLTIQKLVDKLDGMANE